jgi:hypothetical protein
LFVSFQRMKPVERSDVAVSVKGAAICMSVATGTIDAFYNFTPQFLQGAFMFAAQALEIEETNGSKVSDDLEMRHRALVVAAVTQAEAALESAISEVLMHGPGHHLGSNGVDADKREFLINIADDIDKLPTLVKYQLVLDLLQKRRFEKGSQPFQDADLLVKLRNELIHYKSHTGQKMSAKKLFSSLRSLKHKRAPFISPQSPYFPHICLSATCAKWASSTAVKLINGFCKKIDIVSPLEPYRRLFV